MSDHSRLGQLRRMASLNGVNDAALEWLAAHVVEVELAAGYEFISEGARTRECYFIVTGEARVSKEGTTLGVTGPGEPEGEVALFLGVPRTATATAVSDTTALRLDATDYDLLRATDRALAEHLRVAICRHLAYRFGLPSFAGVPRDSAAY